MSVAIVTDSAAAIPDDLVARWRIAVVPMWLTVGGKAEPEGARPLVEVVREADVHTAAPTPGEFSAAVGRCLESATEVVVLTMAASMSATNESALVGCAAFGDTVRVVDTRSAAGGEALVVLAAARAAATGADGADVAARAAAVARRVRLVATLPGLDHLVRGGRVPNVAGWAGRRLGVNPLFEFRDGRVHTLRPALSSVSALDRIVGHVRRTASTGGRLHAAVLHAEDLLLATELLRRLAGEFSLVDPFVGAFGPAMVVHTGPGVAGIAWWWEAPPDGAEQAVSAS